jgi:hypothetical protein
MTLLAQIVLDPVAPVPLLVLLAGLLLAVSARIYFRVASALPRGLKLTLFLLRASGILLVCALLLQPSRQEFFSQPARERVTLIGVDTSLSMKQRDVENASRLDAAKNLLVDSGCVGRNGIPENPRLRMFEFGADAEPVGKSVLDLAPKDKTTRLNKSVLSIMGSQGGDQSPNGLILLTDAHDFEMVNPVKTGSAARSRQVPIYGVALGKQGKVRDVSCRITSFQPYCYVKQRARLSAALRLIGCEFEDLTVQLLRQGQPVQTRRLNAEEQQEIPVEFEVLEPEVGQYEYEIRVQPLEREVDTSNNSAITYLNVIDQQIRALILEGDPYWDTTFLQRSLMRNDKFDVDAMVRFGKDKVRVVRKTENAGPLRAPDTLDELARYDVIVLGRCVDQLLTPPQIALLDAYVKDRAGTLLFARGQPLENAFILSELEPVLWSEVSGEKLRVEATAEGRGLAAFRALQEAGAGMDALPEIVAGYKPGETKPMTTVLATTSNGEGSEPVPAIVHRRYGRGQVVSVGVAGLWRWGLNAKLEGNNTPFDRFWDQLTLWLLAGRDFIPSRQFSFRPNSANILLGEKAHFRLTMRQPDPKLTMLPVTVFFGDQEAGRVNLSSPSDPARLVGEYLPERTGRYRAVARFPDGSTQESRFIVFTENLEETEVATDTLCLRRLCESSGGRLIEPSELGRLVKELTKPAEEITPKVRLRPLWNDAWVFYLAGVLFSLDWFLRRRWGLC